MGINGRNEVKSAAMGVGMGHITTPLVYSSHGIAGTDVLAVKRRLASHLSFKMEQEYSKLASFLQARI